MEVKIVKELKYHKINEKLREIVQYDKVYYLLGTILRNLNYFFLRDQKIKKKVQKSLTIKLVIFFKNLKKKKQI